MNAPNTFVSDGLIHVKMHYYGASPSLPLFPISIYLIKAKKSRRIHEYAVFRCRVRKSTYLRLQLLAKEDYQLSSLMEESLLRDRLSPVLIQRHLQAMDRRLRLVLQVLAGCIEKEGYINVVEEDLVGDTTTHRSPGHR